MKVGRTVKLLYILNIAKRVNNFSFTSMMAAQKLGVEFHIAGNWSYASDEERQADEKQYGIKIHQIDFIRAPYHPGNRTAYIQLKNLVQKEKYDVIHCNTPIGGVLGRIVAKRCGVPKVIYQAHGFHFFKGAPKLNWLIYYPIEKWLAHYTDAIITINQEDYEFAKTKLKLRKGGAVYYVPGVGIDTTQYNSRAVSREAKRRELNLPEDAVVLLSAGELNINKNNQVIISAMEQINQKNIHYVLCGVGVQEAALRRQADAAGLHDNVHFLGYRTDIKELYKMADCFVMPSYREGLSRSLMEAMASGLPCVASAIRGNEDLIENGVGGYLCPSSDVDGFAKALYELVQNPELRQKMKENNLERIKEFDDSVVEREIRAIYQEVLGEASDIKE